MESVIEFPILMIEGLFDLSFAQIFSCLLVPDCLQH